MSGLTVVQRLRLYETLGTVAEALPSTYRKDFYRASRWRAAGVPDDSDIRRRRAIIRAQLPDLALNDWRWLLAALPDDIDPTTGDRGVTLRRWARDAGHVRRLTERNDRG